MTERLPGLADTIPDNAIPDAPRPDEATRLDEATRPDDRSRLDEDESRSPLFAEAAAAAYRTRWQEIQAEFIDDPRRAVERADELVGELMDHLTESFARERAGLEDRWDGGGHASTEDLRTALRHYRSFFARLLSL